MGALADTLKLKIKHNMSKKVKEIGRGGVKVKVEESVLNEKMEEAMNGKIEAMEARLTASLDNMLKDILDKSHLGQN